jgi:hypothetical protein
MSDHFNQVAAVLQPAAASDFPDRILIRFPK